MGRNKTQSGSRYESAGMRVARNSTPFPRLIQLFPKIWILPGFTPSRVFAPSSVEARRRNARPSDLPARAAAPFGATRSGTRDGQREQPEPVYRKDASVECDSDETETFKAKQSFRKPPIIKPGRPRWPYFVFRYPLLFEPKRTIIR